MPAVGSNGMVVLSLNDFLQSNKRDDGIRDAGLTTPDDIVRYDNIRYGEDERNFLDVYRPKNAVGKLPVIVSIHGGGWVYGDKELMQFYCMSLAQRGFAVVNFSYRIAPKDKHPAPLEDANKVFYWVKDNAERYGLDFDNVFAVGDSIGANLVGLYCCLCIDKEYAKTLSIFPPEGFLPKAVGLNCGLYKLKRGENDVLIDDLASYYLPMGGTDEEYAEISVETHLVKGFPASFVMTALGDFLSPQAEPFCKALCELGVEVEMRVYGTEQEPLRHVFHVDMRLDESKVCNDDECDFFKKHVTKK